MFHVRVLSKHRGTILRDHAELDVHNGSHVLGQSGILDTGMQKYGIDKGSVDRAACRHRPSV
jgi:hypothetical protein